jgi:hypothetical protein
LFNNYKETAQQLIQQPQESLAVEPKAWINPSENEGIAKIVKTDLAIIISLIKKESNRQHRSIRLLR